MTLTTSDRKRLIDALVSAFPTKGALERMVLFHLDFRLGHKVNLDAGLEQVVFDLIDVVEQRSEVHRLVAGAALERPDHDGLKAFCVDLRAGEQQRLLPSPPPNPPGGSLPAVWADGFAQYCNREPQWREIEASGYRDRSELVFVPGAFEQGHEFLMKRIMQRRDIDPKSVVLVDQPNSYAPPTCRREWLAMLGAALGVREQSDDPDDEMLQRQIAAALVKRLSERTAILVHPIISMDFRDDIRSYYTAWLPGVLTRARALGGSLKCVKVYQAIEWLQLSWANRLRSWLGLSGSSTVSRPDLGGAERLMMDIVSALKQDAQVLRVRRLPTMADITDDDLVALCRHWAIEDPDKHEDLVRQCAGARTSLGKLKIADRYLPRLLPADPTDLRR
jgi:hypothetical protein